MDKTGKFEDARRSYNQVLDLLTRQTSLTSGEKEKRDNLVLTAHLNLAACELKLGDNAKVIKHCSLALQMDKESMKAFFRRGLAYHNNNDYDLALKDYLEAERLQPQNPEVRKQKEKLLADKMEARARVADQETLDGATEEDCHEMVVVYEGDEEADLRDYEKRCSKAARHNEYIPVSQFCLDHLPEQYRTDKMLTCVKALISRTVLLEVKHSSSERPEFVPGTTTKYPCSSPMYRNAIRSGSGCVSAVLMYPEHGNKVCPCDTCKSSGKPKTQFAEIQIATAAHVIFDIKEARKSTCYFDFNDDQTDQKSCPGLRTAVDIYSNIRDDSASVHFVTHDLQLAEKLLDAHYSFFSLCRQLKLDIGIIQDEDEEKMELSVKFSNLHEKYQESFQKLSHVIDRAKEIINGDAEKMWEDYLQKYNIKSGEGIPSGYGTFLYDKMNSGNMWKYTFKQICAMYEMFVPLIDGIRHIKDNFKAVLEQDGYQSVLDKYRCYRDDLMEVNKPIQWMFREMGDSTAHGASDGEHLESKFYDFSHPFTIIVSHPHGLGKKISLGEVTNRNVDVRYDKSRYQYTNTTCPGSSGAPVYTIGRLSVGPGHPHSKMVQIQKNQSGIYIDI